MLCRIRDSESTDSAGGLLDAGTRIRPERELIGTGVGVDYAAALLGWCGAAVRRSPGPEQPHPAVEWARSGAMALTGRPEGPPLLAPGPLAACARGALEALRTLGGE